MGFADEMFAQLRSNKTLRKNLHRRDEHFNMKDADIKRRKNIKYNFPKASQKLLNSIRRSAREENKKENKNRIFALIVAVLLTAMIFGAIFIELNK